MAKAQVEAKIWARKVALVFFYQRLSLERFSQKPEALQDVIALDHRFLQSEKWDEQQQELAGKLWELHQVDLWDHIEYILEQFFSKISLEDINTDYLKLLADKYDTYAPKITELVDQYTTSFSYEQMDMMHQAIFLLGYVEAQATDTPTQIIVSEMVELTKRYCEPTTAKMMNAIGHKLLDPLKKKK